MNRIKSIRAKLGIKQKDLAKMLNCSHTAISNYETGYRDLDSDTIIRLCSVFGCTSDYLLGLSDNPTPVISDADALLLHAYHEAPPNIVAAIDNLLQPYQKENKADQVS